MKKAQEMTNEELELELKRMMDILNEPQSDPDEMCPIIEELMDEISARRASGRMPLLKKTRAKSFDICDSEE